MSYSGSIVLKKYSDEANKQFDDMQKVLSDVETNFYTRIEGNTKGKLIGNFAGTICWLVVFIIAAIVVKGFVPDILIAVALISLFGLVAFMLVDTVMSYSYYEKLYSYKDAVSLLQNRVSMGKSSIDSNYNSFIESRSKGWYRPLQVGESISDEATLIEASLAEIKALKTGAISKAKDVFFFFAVVMVTLVSCIAMFPVGEGIIEGISGEDFGDCLVFNIIALVIVGACEIILAKFVWSKTNCSATCITLLVLLFAPVAFPALIALVTGIIILVVAVVAAVLYIAGFVIAAAIAWACLCGG